MSKTKKKKLDETFSRYIRLKYADDQGDVVCYTCGVKKHVKSMQCGHYVSRGHLSARFNEENCRPQCYACNCKNSGKYKEFTIELIDEIGREKVDELLALKHVTKRISSKEYDVLLEEYKEKVDKLKKEKGVHWKKG